MFAAVSDLYRRYWGDYFHFAIFESDDEPMDEALDRTHRKYLDELRVADASRVLELACGRGPFTEYLARNSGAEVLGIERDTRGRAPEARRPAAPRPIRPAVRGGQPGRSARPHAHQQPAALH